MKKITCTFLCILMLFALAFPAFAKEAEKYGLWVNGVEITSENLRVECGEGYAEYEPGTATLTLSDAEITESHTDGIDCAAIYAENEITVDVVGYNTIYCGDDPESYYTDGICTWEDLTFIGDGILIVSGGEGELGGYGVYSYHAIYQSSPCIFINAETVGMKGSNGIFITGGEIMSAGSRNAVSGGDEEGIVFPDGTDRFSVYVSTEDSLEEWDGVTDLSTYKMIDIVYEEPLYVVSMCNYKNADGKSTLEMDLGDIFVTLDIDEYPFEYGKQYEGLKGFYTVCDIEDSEEWPIVSASVCAEKQENGLIYVKAELTEEDGYVFNVDASTFELCDLSELKLSVNAPEAGMTAGEFICSLELALPEDIFIDSYGIIDLEKNANLEDGDKFIAGHSYEINISLCTNLNRFCDYTYDFTNNIDFGDTAFTAEQGFSYGCLDLKINLTAGAVYEITEGANSTWNKGSVEGLTFRSEADFAKFESVSVDGCELTEDQYEVSEGSTVVKLKASYLETLEEGEHTLIIFSNDGSARTTFVIANVTRSAPTGDGIVTYILICLASAAIFGAAAVLGKKKYNR